MKGNDNMDESIPDPVEKVKDLQKGSSRRQTPIETQNAGSRRKSCGFERK